MQQKTTVGTAIPTVATAMAKKATKKRAAKSAGVATKTKSPGIGKKHCPKCGEIIAARAMSHEACGWVGEKKSKNGKQAAVASVNRVDNAAATVKRITNNAIDTAFEFVKSVGGLDTARHLMDRLAEFKKRL